jgi:hypothetical protein
MAILTTKGKPLFPFGGYEYRFSKLTDDGDKKYWRCVRKKCSGSIKTELDDSNPVVLNTQHIHIPNPQTVEVRQVVQTMQQRAADEVVSISRIYTDEVTGLAGSPATAAQMPAFQQVKSSLHKKRRAQYPPMPASRAVLVIPNNMTTTTAGQNFLLHSAANNEFLIFATTGTADFIVYCRFLNKLFNYLSKA